MTNEERQRQLRAEALRLKANARQMKTEDFVHAVLAIVERERAHAEEEASRERLYCTGKTWVGHRLVETR